MFICGNEFSTKHDDMHWRERKYCSRICSQRSNFKGEMTRTCIHCGKEMIRKLNVSTKWWAKRKFCSKKCNNLHMVKKSKFKCLSCGEEFKTERYREQIRKYCKKCNKKVPHRKIDLTTSKRLGGDSKNRLIKNVTYENKCEICGYDKFIELSHIIPVRDSGTMEPWNILSLCPNHHKEFDKMLLSDEDYSIIKGKIENAFAMKE